MRKGKCVERRMREGVGRRENERGAEEEWEMRMVRYVERKGRGCWERKTSRCEKRNGEYGAVCKEK